MGNTNQLFDSLFKRDLSANDNKDFLTDLTKEHPYFTAAQFYLLQLTEADSPSYNKQAAKTAILFNNPLWLNFQLNESVASHDLREPIASKEAIDDKGAYDVEIEALEKIQPLTGATTETVFDNEKLIVSAMDAEKDATVINEIVPELQDTISGQLTEAVSITGEKINEPENSKDENYDDEEDEMIKETETEPEKAVALLANLPEADTVNRGKINDAENNDENYDYEGDDITEEEEKEIEPMNIKLNFTSAASTTEDTITFEPLHRSDYFASVGIKLSEEIKPGDKLGKQLKSFTDWLKTMKKIHEEQLPQQNEQSDILIQKMAEKSNTEGEVLTETMAEVLLQQGKYAKATEVYQKLSLLNPAKSIYFAAKIEQIKK